VHLVTLITPSFLTIHSSRSSPFCQVRENGNRDVDEQDNDSDDNVAIDSAMRYIRRANRTSLQEAEATVDDTKDNEGPSEPAMEDTEC